jgi:hypothetical protein
VSWRRSPLTAFQTTPVNSESVFTYSRMRTGMRLPGGHIWTDLSDYWRQLELPECPHCGSDRIEPSASRRREAPLSWLGLLPYRCVRCLRRSYLRARRRP